MYLWDLLASPAASNSASGLSAWLMVAIFDPSQKIKLDRGRNCHLGLTVP